MYVHVTWYDRSRKRTPDADDPPRVDGVDTPATGVRIAVARDADRRRRRAAATNSTPLSTLLSSVASSASTLTHTFASAVFASTGVPVVVARTFLCNPSINPSHSHNTVRSQRPRHHKQASVGGDPTCRRRVLCVWWCCCWGGGGCLFVYAYARACAQCKGWCARSSANTTPQVGVNLAAQKTFLWILGFAATVTATATASVSSSRHSLSGIVGIGTVITKATWHADLA